MKRNYFTLFLALIVTASLFSSCNNPRQNNAAGTNAAKEIYIQLYSVRDDIKNDYFATIAEVAAIGYTGVEAAGYNNGQFYGLSPAEFRQSIEDTGMTLLSSHVERSLPGNVEEADWDDIWAWWDQAFQAHKEAGIKYLVTPWMPMVTTLSDLRAYIAYYNEIGARANAAGLRFGYHNHAFEFEEVEGVIWLDYMLENTDPEKVFFQLDIYWTVVAGKDPVDYFNRFPGRFLQLHVKDEKELGRSGMMDFEHIFNNLQNSGVRYMIVEVEQYTGTPMDGIRESFHFLNDAPWFKSSYSK